MFFGGLIIESQRGLHCFMGELGRKGAFHPVYNSSLRAITPLSGRFPQGKETAQLLGKQDFMYWRRVHPIMALSGTRGAEPPSFPTSPRGGKTSHCPSTGAEPPSFPTSPRLPPIHSLGKNVGFPSPVAISLRMAWQSSRNSSRVTSRYRQQLNSVFLIF